MYALIELEDNEGMKLPAELFRNVKSLGLDVQFADDVLGLLHIAGFEVENPEEFEDARNADADVRARYDKLRKDADTEIIAAGDSAEKTMLHIERVKAKALVDIAESLAFLTGSRH